MNKPTQLHLLAITLSVSFLSACGGSSGGDTNVPSPSPVPTPTPAPTPTEPVTLSHNAGINRLSGAIVEILSVDGQSLYFTSTTDEQGSYHIAQEELDSALDMLSDDDPLLVRVTGGVESYTDEENAEPDSQGRFNGTLYSLVSKATLMKAQPTFTNSFTTLLYDYSKDAEDITQAADNAAATFGFDDVDKDGNVNAVDVALTHPDKLTNRLSRLLKYGYNLALVTGNEEYKAYTNSYIQRNFGLTQVATSINGNTIDVMLEPSAMQNDILIGLNQNTEMSPYAPGEVISLPDGEALFYRQCETNGNCYKTKTTFFHQGQVYDGLLSLVPFGPIFDLLTTALLRERAISSSSVIADLSPQLAALNTALEEKYGELVSHQQILDDALDKLGPFAEVEGEP